MKITEILISICLCLIISTSIFFAFNTFDSRYRKIISETVQCKNILCIDKSFRDVISNFKIMYFQKKSEDIFMLEQKILDIAKENKCQVFVMERKEKKGVCVGYKLVWKYFDEQFETKENFANRIYF